MEVGKFTVSESLKLAKIFLERLSFREGRDVVCLAIKLFFSSIHQWQSDPLDGENNDKVNKADVERLKKDYVRQISETLVSALKRILIYEMPDDYRSDALKRELQVRIIIMQRCRNSSRWNGLAVSLLIR